MFGLQTTIIAIGISLLAGLGIGGYTAYSFTADHYQAKIAKERTAATNAYLAKQDELIQQERTNAQITQSLEKLSSEYARKRDSDAAAIRKLLADRNNWVRSPCTVEATAGASDSTSGKPASEAGHATLSTEFSEYMVKELERADSLIGYANTCYGYVQEIEKQRERMQNE